VLNRESQMADIVTLPVVRVERCNDIAEKREIIARALYRRRRGQNPDWPVGVDKNGYAQEPYVRTVPGWEWFHGGDADAVLAALHQS
jgi:hypothetical protein